jgi:hypothetical protein
MRQGARVIEDIRNPTLVREMYSQVVRVGRKNRNRTISGVSA